MVMGRLRLAKAMPRQPHTSMWFSATASIRSCISPGPGGGGGSTSASRASRSPKRRSARTGSVLRRGAKDDADVLPAEAEGRSEEHTSELQSRQYLVCRLLLEKKKKT